MWRVVAPSGNTLRTGKPYLVPYVKHVPQEWEPVLRNGHAATKRGNKTAGCMTIVQDMMRALLPLVIVTGTALAQDDRFPLPGAGRDGFHPGPERASGADSRARPAIR